MVQKLRLLGALCVSGVAWTYGMAQEGPCSKGRSKQSRSAYVQHDSTEALTLQYAAASSQTSAQSVAVAVAASQSG